METESQRETIGQRLLRLRQEMGFSQRQLARGTNFTSSYISRIERGSRNPSLKALRQLASNLGVSADYLETGQGTSMSGEPILTLEELIRQVQRRLPQGIMILIESESKKG